MAEINYINGYEIADAKAREDASEALENTDRINDIDDELQIEKSTRQSTDTDLQSQISSLASGSPLVASSISGMTDTTKVYVNTTDGKWYYYNGSTWVAGGTYQSTGIGSNEISEYQTNFIKVSFKGNLIDNGFIEYNHHYMHGNGVISRSDAINYVFKYDKDFLGDNVDFKQEYVSGMYLYDENDTYLATVNVNNIKSSLDANPTYKYLRFWCYGNRLDVVKFYLKDADKNKTYYEYKNLVIDSSQLDGFIQNKNIEDYSLSIEKMKYLELSKTGNILSDHFIEIDGYFIDRNGNIVHNDNNSTLIYKYTKEYLDTTNNNYRIYLVAGGGISAWDENNNYLGSMSGYQGEMATFFETYPNYSYIRIWTYKTGIATSVFANSEYFVNGLKNKYTFDNLIVSSEQLINSELFGKSIVFFGDSWTAPNSEKDYTFSEYVRLHNTGVITQNCGRNGADWSQGYSYWFGEHYEEINKDFDYIIIESYTNGLYTDVDTISKPLGTINEFTYYNSIEEIEQAYQNSYARDLEKMLFACVNRWKGKKIGLMFPYKAVAMMEENNAFRQFRPQVLACCRKYNIPVFDNFDSSNIPTFTQEDIDTYFFHGDNHGEHGDGVHLNSAGSALVNPRIDKWIKTL